jgi:hypothetical protein
MRAGDDFDLVRDLDQESWHGQLPRAPPDRGEISTPAPAERAAFADRSLVRPSWKSLPGIHVTGDISAREILSPGGMLALGASRRDSARIIA